MSVSNYEDLEVHVGHEMECTSYAQGANVAVECLTCGSIIIDFDREETEEA